MKIDQKIFYISFILLLFFSAGFYLFVPNFAINTFKSLEESAAIQEANDMRYFVGKEIDSLDSLNEEWSRRSDLYNFFNSNDDEKDSFVSNSFDFDYIKNLNVGYLSIVTSDGHLLYGVEMDGEDAMPAEFAVGLSNSLIAKTGKGLVRSWSNDHVMAVSVKPIIRDGDSPVGYIIMAKTFDENIITYDGKSFSLEEINSSLGSSVLGSSKNGIYIDKSKPDTLNVYSFYDDILGNRIFYSKINIARDVYKAGVSTINAISYSALVLQLLMIISFLAISQRLIIKRLSLLVSSIQSVVRSKKQEEVVIFSGNDEISSLSREINNAFVKINNANHISRERQEDLASTIKSMHDIIIIFDKNNNVTSYYFPENNTKKNVNKDFLSKGFISKVIVEIENIKNEGGVRSIDYSMVRNRKKHWYNVNISAKKDISGGFDGATLVIRDVTESRIMQSEMEEKIKELQRLNKLMIGREMKMIELKQELKKSKK